MYWFHRLADINEPSLFLPPENVVLGQIRVYQVTRGVQAAHHLHNLIVRQLQFLTLHSLCRFLQLGSGSSFVTNEGHEEDMLLENHDVRNPDATLGHLDQVVHLFLSPHVDDLPGILLAEPISESVIILGEHLYIKLDFLFKSSSPTLMYLSLVLNSLRVVLKILTAHSFGTFIGSSDS